MVTSWFTLDVKYSMGLEDKCMYNDFSHFLKEFPLPHMELYTGIYVDY